jgi:transposase
MTGRKSDVRDARRLADLHAHGLIRGSFVPPPEIDGLRALTRTRKQLVQEITRHTQRIQKILDVANIKITGLITDVLGVSGRAMVKALIAGESDLQKLAALAHPRLTASRAKLVEALDGTLTDDDRWLLGMHLRQVEGLEQEIAALDERIGKVVEPFRELVDRIEQMPGMSDVSTPALLAEIGIDMSKFPRHGHLISWARICPRNDESAGKIQSRRTLKGSRWIKALMTQAAWAASRKKDSYYRAQFLRLCRTTDKKRAIVAVAASMLTAIYYMIRDRTPYRDLGFQHFDTCDRTKAARRLVSRLKTLGYGVQLTG